MHVSQPIKLKSPRPLPHNACAPHDNDAWTTLTPLYIDSNGDCLERQPVSVGVPVARGIVHDTAELLVLDAMDRPVPLQTSVLARWPDGSLKWVLLDFALPGVRQGSNPWTLAKRPVGSGTASAGVVVTEDPHTVVVDTGVAAFCLGRGWFAPFTRVLLGSKDTLRSAACVLTDARGRTRAPLVDQVVIEARGPVRATICFTGQFTGRTPCRFTARLSFFAGTGLVRLELTIHNPQRAAHRGGLWDLGDPGSFYFRDLSLELEMDRVAPSEIRWADQQGQPYRTAHNGLEIYQDSSGGEQWNCKNHVNRYGHVPCSFRGYRVCADGHDEKGLRASPIVGMGCTGGHLSVAVPDFWQQFPKALEVEGSRLRVRLFPKQFDDLFELQGGEQKTHTVWLSFAPNASPALTWVHAPARVRARPEWYESSGAMDHFAASAADADEPMASLLTPIVAGPSSFFAKREIIDEYGWRHFGEVYADHESAYYNGPRPVISHYNNQYDVIYGTLTQYLRTGDGRWLDLCGPLARHVVDIDIYHTDADKAAYNGGLFWFTDHYKDAATSTHRTYSRHNCCPGDRTYGGGPGSNHNFTTGLLHFYYLTGDAHARAAVLGLADWVINMDDGRKHWLELIDPGPTGLATATGELTYQGPGRGPGNSVNALLDAWLLSGSRQYLQKAEEFIQRAAHPCDDIAALDLLDAEKRWSYTVFLSVLARYLELKAEAGELDYGYAYGRATLLAYATWMLANEIPYLDRADQLQYPTEVWAGQELRKANVLQTAAAYADQPLRTRFVRRGREIADRASRDLLGFESRTVARAAALVMVEGARAAYLRTRPLTTAPRPARDYDFGGPVTFVPQRVRVGAELQSVRGAARILLRLASPRTWIRVAKRLVARGVRGETWPD